MTFSPHEARRAVNNTNFAPVVRLLWRVLVDYADEDGRCWPSVETLALDVGVSERHLRRALRALEQRGMVTTTARTGKASTYTLTPDTGVRSTPDTGDRPPRTPESPTPDTGDRGPRTPVTPELARELSKELASGMGAPAPAPDYTDSEAETLCPLDLVDRARKAEVLTALADGLKQPLVSVEAKAQEFVAYWTIGAGTGQKRRHWMRRLRKDVHEAAKRNQLTPPGALEHGVGHGHGNLSPKVAAFLRGET